MSYILGLSYNYHDAAAALLKDGSIVAASTEERHTRKKHDPNYPMRAIATCLEAGGITAAELDWVVYYEQPLVKFARILEMSVRRLGKGGLRFLRSTVEEWAAAGKFDVRDQICYTLGIASDRIRFCDHHLSHAASAYFCSPFQEATIVTLDGVGERETATISIGKGNSITKIESVNLPHSVGLFYSALTAFLGFEVNEGEYKVMGMAGFGDPLYAQELMRWFQLRPGGSFRVRQDMLDLGDGHEFIYPKALVEALGTPRERESPFNPDDDLQNGPGSSRHYANIAASVQSATETVIEHIVTEAVRRTGVPSICLAGGVAMNSAANQRLRRSLKMPMFVQPAAGDAGGALGAAKWLYHCELGGERREVMTSVALGREFSHQQIVAEVGSTYGSRWKEYLDDAALCEAVAELLSFGKVVGWFQGRSEWGPRALGNRSILASPCIPEMKEIVNERIKFREPFRPFAPSVTAPRAREFFEILDVENEDEETNPYNFMLAVCNVRPEARARIPAVTHVDGTARVHTVRREFNPLFYALIEAFERRSGVAVLMNTSFNLRGEPIVDTPRDAIDTFERSGMDALVLGRAMITK